MMAAVLATLVVLSPLLVVGVIWLALRGDR